MPAERLSMRNIREILRLKAMGFSGRKIARSLGLSPTTTSDYLRRAKVARLSCKGTRWPHSSGRMSKAKGKDDKGHTEHRYEHRETLHAPSEPGG